MRVLFFLLMTVFFVVEAPSLMLAQDPAAKIKLIVEAAKEICTQVPLSSTATELSVEGKAKLNGVLKRLIDAGVEGAGKYTSSSSFGVLQKDLANSIKNGNDCRSDFAKTLLKEISKNETPLDQQGKTLLADAQNKCGSGDITAAKRAFQKLKISYPNNPDVIKIDNWCSEEANTPKNITVSLQISPSVFFRGYSGQMFRSSLMLDIDDSFCGRLSTLSNAIDSVECEITPGIHTFSMTSIAVYNSFHQRIADRLKCGGQTKIPIDAERFGVILCFREQSFSCSVMEVDEKFERFSEASCPAI